MTRHYGLDPENPNHHWPGYAPKVILHRVRHRLIGPLLGCSCTRCFHSRWRIVPAREVYRGRRMNAQKFDSIEGRLRKLEAGSSSEACRECGSLVGQGHTGYCSKSAMRGGPGGVVSGADR